MNEMATLHRVKTHSVRIRGVAFRCEPGSRREQILVALLYQDSKGRSLSYFVTGLIAGGMFLAGFVAGRAFWAGFITGSGG